MEVTGKIILALPEMTGVSKAGNPWKKREYVLETFESYPRKIHFDFFGEKADQFQLQVGQNIKLSFDIESREYNGRWFTSIRGWKVDPADGDAQAPTAAYAAPAAAYGAPAAPATAVPGAVPPPPSPAASTEEDLPF